MKTSQNLTCNDSILNCILSQICRIWTMFTRSKFVNYHYQAHFTNSLFLVIECFPWERGTVWQKESTPGVLRPICLLQSNFSQNIWDWAPLYIYQEGGGQKHSRLAHLQVDKHLHPSAYILGDIWAQDSRSKKHFSVDEKDNTKVGRWEIICRRCNPARLLSAFWSDYPWYVILQSCNPGYVILQGYLILFD